MQYHEKALAIDRFGAAAAEQITKDYIDLFTSLDETDVWDKVVSWLRLNAERIQTAKSVDEMVGVLSRALGYLLFSKKIEVASYGLSNAGRAQFDALVALVHVRKPTEDPKIAEYREFNRAADAVEYQTRVVADEGFRQWANTAK